MAGSRRRSVARRTWKKRQDPPRWCQTKRMQARWLKRREDREGAGESPLHAPRIAVPRVVWPPASEPHTRGTQPVRIYIRRRARLAPRLRSAVAGFQSNRCFTVL